MKKNRTFVVGPLCFFCLLHSAPIFAENLVQVYDQAFQNDPIFKQARANWHSQEMNLPIARAAYLPQFGVQANGSRDYAFVNPTSLTPIYGYYWTYGYTATLQQPVFALSAWHSIQQASANVKAAAATYLAAQQDLMQRTVSAYLEVLKRHNTLFYVTARKDAIHKQWMSAKETYHAGLIAITDVYDAESRYDVAITQEIIAKNNLNIALEQLRAITGHYYTNLAALKRAIPLTVPKPASIDAWTQASESENYNIQAQNFTVLAALKNIKRLSTQDTPVVSLASSYGQTKDFADNGNKTTNDTALLGLNLTYQPIQGGLVYASTEQAQYDYVAASGKLEEVHRQVVETTRSSFLSVLAGIDAIQSDKVNIISSEKALDAASAGLKVGTRTMIDVLLDLSNVYINKQQLVEDEYSYLSNVIQLKNASGRLSGEDLARVNKDLVGMIQLPKVKQVELSTQYHIKTKNTAVAALSHESMLSIPDPDAVTKSKRSALT